jgi:hypothetical protein
MIAIELCRLLHTETSTKVSAIVLIDTPDTQRWKARGRKASKYEPEISSSSAWLRQGIKKRFEAADDLVDHWCFPRSSDLERSVSAHQAALYGLDTRKLPLATSGHPVGNLSNTSALAKLRFDRKFLSGLRLQHQKSLLPPSMLLRAVYAVPNPSAVEDGVIRVDLDRSSPLLGWEHSAVDFIRVVQDVPGDHYNMFEGSDKVRCNICKVVLSKNLVIEANGNGF